MNKWIVRSMVAASGLPRVGRQVTYWLDGT